MRSLVHKSHMLRKKQDEPNQYHILIDGLHFLDTPLVTTEVRTVHLHRYFELNANVSLLDFYVIISCCLIDRTVD